MTLPHVEPTDSVIGGWIAACSACDGWSARAGCLSAALENMGDKGVIIMLSKMKLDSSLDVVRWLDK